MIDTVSVPRAEPASPAHSAAGDGELAVDRLASSVDPVQVVLLNAFEVGSAGEPAREPHRHDYHELIWIREGTGQHILDGREVPVVPGSLTVIGRGQVHVV